MNPHFGVGRVRYLSAFLLFLFGFLFLKTPQCHLTLPLIVAVRVCANVGRWWVLFATKEAQQKTKSSSSSR